jgi:hypothetical protein
LVCHVGDLLRSRVLGGLAVVVADVVYLCHALYLVNVVLLVSGVTGFLLEGIGSSFFFGELTEILVNA